MTNQTPIEEATGYLEARRYQNAILRQEDCAPIDTIQGKPLTARTVDALLEQIKLDEQRLTELRRQLDAAEAAGCACGDLFADVAAITAWLDESNPDTAHEDSMRVLKLVEESGEAAAAYIGMVGQNPRKGVTHTREEFLAELADVVLTALCAIQHFTKDAAATRSAVAAKVERITTRAGIARNADVQQSQASAEPNALESAITEALADLAADPADPEPAPIRPPWLVEAGDD